MAVGSKDHTPVVPCDIRPRFYPVGTWITLDKRVDDIIPGIPMMKIIGGQVMGLSCDNRGKERIAHSFASQLRQVSSTGVMTLFVSPVGVHIMRIRQAELGCCGVHESDKARRVARDRMG